eukprot:CAMPEP_0171453750 /NCGR_PEP_ID=MMETSP0945-20130129/1327_1 /TAXON_ID=109269 /ORGANISM="Vaucheria litorea, Strain CCMP2940" /LENGTH=44 /DNA_ID= /DNA_START= /DNA_END= /DNA_ORIENTATION=
MSNARASLAVSMTVVESWKAKHINWSTRDNKSLLHNLEATSNLK